MNRTLCKSLWGAVLVVLVAGCAAPRQEQETRAPGVDGSWSIISATLGGQDLPVAALQGTPLELHDGHYTFQNDTGTYAVLPNTDPAALDVIGVRGPNAGKTFPSIFKLDGDTLTICYDLAMMERPREFVSPPATQIFLARYTRSSS